jgi:hypothetical protein
MQDFPELGVVKMTQEIGFVEPLNKEFSIDFEKLPIGKPLFLYQYHSCDTAAKFPVSIHEFIHNTTEYLLI